MLGVEGKVVVVTGGNGGIGLGFARGIARAGGDVAVWGRRADRNEAAADELRALGTNVLAQTVDVADEAAVDAAMTEAVVTLGRVDGIIVNAGVMTPGRSFLEISGDEYANLLAVNQHGAWYSARAAARHMKQRHDAGDPGGSILFCASISARTGSPGMQHYNAAKGAVASLSRGIAVEGGRYGIRSNVVCPAYTATERVPAGAMGPELVARCPIPRMGTPEDFEGIGVYFMSDASRYHTGDLVTIDGGWMANAGKSDISKLPEWP